MTRKMWSKVCSRSTWVMFSVALIVALLSVVFVQTPTAQAQAEVSDERVDFGGIDGESRAVRIVGDQLWVGGVFSTALDTDLVTSHPRTNLAVFNMNSGDVLPIAPNPNDEVRTIESDDATSVWIGGSFTEIAGESQAYIAAFDPLTGDLREDFDLTVDDQVYDVHYADGWLYLGGLFRTVNGQPFDRLARVDPRTGAVDESFRPDPNANVRSIDTFGDLVYVAGFFDRIGQSPNRVDRLWVAGLNVNTGIPEGPDFALLPLGPDEAPKKAGVRRIEISADGRFLFTGDRRNTLTAFDRATGNRDWRITTQGDIQAIQTAGTLTYVGTHDGLFLKNDTRLLFAMNDEGEVHPDFAPTMNSFNGTQALDFDQGALVAVGAFTRVDREDSPHIAVFHGPDWQGATPIDPSHLLGDVNCNGQIDLGDALVAAQFSVGGRILKESCVDFDSTTDSGPGGDVNGDGRVDLGDALLIGQCAVGVTNLFCPA